MHESLVYPDLPPLFRPAMMIARDVGIESNYQELKAYQEMNGITMSQLEISTVKDIQYTMRSAKNGAKPQEILEAFGYG